MRLMSFSLTAEQMLAQTKTVTRRIGWQVLRPGTLLQPVRKAMGLKKGEQVERLGPPIRVVDVRRERLDQLTWTECQLEGFPTMPPAEFIAMFCRTHKPCQAHWLVTRIAFEFTEAR